MSVVVTLPAFDSEKAVAAVPDLRPGGIFGVGRALPEEQARLALKWSRTSEGEWSAGVRVVSPMAAGLRLALRSEGLPDGGTLRFSGATGRPADVSGAEINAAVRANRRANPQDEAADIFWSPLVQGDKVRLTIELPGSADPAAVKLELPRISHFVRWPGTAAEETPDCWEDVACHPQWERQSRATAMMISTRRNGTSGVCTGVLLRDADPTTQIPYFLTAHHCVPDQIRASSIETYWFFRAEDCGAGIGEVQAVPGGADMLYAEKNVDTVLLRLRQPPPAGAAFVDWSPMLPADGAELVGVLHPLGQAQIIAFGQVTQYLNCGVIDSCSEGADPEAIHFLEVTWRKGVTEGGGSGSGVFLPSGQLVGTLSGLVSECGSDDNFTDYGRFDIPYRDALHKWLGREPAER